LDRIVLEVAGIKGEAEYTTTASIYLEPVERYPVGSQIKTTIELPPEASLIDAHGFAVKVRLSKPCINTFSLQAPETMRVFGPFGSRVLRAPFIVDKAPLVSQLTVRVLACASAASSVKPATNRKDTATF
jgi:hypothetical protein